MRRTTMLLAAMLAGAPGCDDKAPPTAAEAKTAAPHAPTAAATPASAAPAPPPPASSAPPAPPAPPAKVYDCGAKEQKPCPMQGWMKTVMANAASSDDGQKLAQALGYVAAHVPPGYKGWAAMANDGVAKAKAGDIDGAKASCKQCHDTYKEDYKNTMRDRPW